jgi:Fic family protein
MAIQETRHWPPEIRSALPRRDRRGCEYAAYIPDPLAVRAILLEGEVAAEVADAEAAITRMNVEPGAQALIHSEALARLLLRAEAVASSRIEGLEVGARRLLRAEAAQALGDEPRDVTAEEVLANIRAIAWAVDGVAGAEAISVDHLLEINRLLLGTTRLAAKSGRLREEQNWIGGSSYNPCSAAFVPPPPELVPALLEDLCRFCNADLLPAVAQAAIAHAQFETIHPFVDGNGRTGRALIHVLLRRRGITPRLSPPISLILATWSDDYVNGLSATRYLGDPSSAEAQQGLNRWIALFAAACTRAVSDAYSYEDQICALQRGWRAKLGRVRHESSVALLLDALPGAPILTVSAAATLIGRSFQATNEAMRRFEAAGVLKEARAGSRRNRVFEAPDLIDAFTDLERRLASPAADTRLLPVVRPSPGDDQAPMRGRRLEAHPCHTEERWAKTFVQPGPKR